MKRAKIKKRGKMKGTSDERIKTMQINSEECNNGRSLVMEVISIGGN